MRLQELGSEIRRARLGRGLTQAELAASAGLSRQTLNLLENGLIRELGVRKVLALLDELGIELTIEHGKRLRRPDYVRMACTTASVSFRHTLGEDELVRALVTGRIPENRGAHIRTLFDEAPAALLNGLAAEAGRWIDPGKLERNLLRLARDADATRKVSEWLKTV
ncbi:MAG TPA: helix-turn-helix domain-containing protein [Burkholderiales bacterium]|nr:helix-turn-helix domain-containing protein [Burkholderiales bacterium]